jgi:ABC-type nitrate/sulfonate/bicarbonate transport system substrate-binding protein
LALKRIITVLIVLILIIVAVTALLIYMNPPSKTHQNQLEPVTVGAEFSQVNTLLFIAQNMSYFSDNGLNVTIRSYISGAAALEAMVDGDVDIAASSEFTVVNKILGDTNISIIGAIDRFEQINLAARRDRGIQNVTDLVNKSIGLTPGTSAEYFFGRFLELNGMNHSQVKTVNIQPNHMVEALTNGTVDAVVTWEPYLYRIHNQMANDIVEWPAQSGQQVYSVLSATNSWLETHNKTVTQFLDAISQAENYLQSNPVDGKNIIMDELNYTQEYLESVWSDHKFTLSLDQSIVLIMEDEGRWLIANDLTNATSVPSFQNYFYRINPG